MAKEDDTEISQTQSNSSLEGDAFRSFNEILGEIGPFQIWTSFLIIVSGLTVSWETLSFPFLARSYTLVCKDPNYVEDACSENCKEIAENPKGKETSIVSQWNLNCENEYKKRLAQGVLIAGVMFGCLFYGHLADQLGRRPTFLSACMVVLIMGIMVGLSPWYWFFCLTRFIMGIGCGGMTIICIVFLVEYVEFNKREFMVVLYRLPYAIGHGSIPAFSYFFTNWRHLQIVTTAFAFIYVSYFWLLPESPRWLFITGQLERCINVLRSGAKRNNRPTEKIRNIVESAYDELRSYNFSRKGTMIDLFKTRNLCKKTLILGAAWFVLYFEFYGILNFMTELSGNIFINFGISAWLTLPFTVLAYPIAKYISRRYSLLVIFIAKAICMFMIILLPKSDDHFLLIVLCTMVLALTAITFVLMHLFSTELFPTILRNSGMGFSIFCGRFGCLVSQFVVPTNKHEFWLPALIFGIISVCIGIILLFLPETKDAILPDTMEEGELFGKDEK